LSSLYSVSKRLENPLSQLTCKTADFFLCNGFSGSCIAGIFCGKGSIMQKRVKSDGYSEERQRTGRREKAAGQRGSGSLKTADGGELHRKP